GGLWKYDYDQRANIIQTQDPLENQTLYTYNSDNLPIAITDANGGEKKLAYNPDGQLTSYYDERGNLLGPRCGPIATQARSKRTAQPP
ncbi:RHS repeat domain-containing protein, partial [Pseudomonas sp. p21]|uniref:RHS repeat domain-containing protein n=1 Tax=Pseudomonas sp. p21 TaxID=1825979 RepID=UPI000AE67BA6